MTVVSPLLNDVANFAATHTLFPLSSSQKCSEIKNVKVCKDSQLLKLLQKSLNHHNKRALHTQGLAAGVKSGGKFPGGNFPQQEMSNVGNYCWLRYIGKTD